MKRKNDHEIGQNYPSEENTMEKNIEFPDTAYQGKTDIEEIYFDIKILIRKTYNELIEKIKPVTVVWEPLKKDALSRKLIKQTIRQTSWN